MRKMISSMCAAAALLISGAAASAAPLVNIQMVVNGGPIDGASTLSVTEGQVVNYRLTALIAPIGTVNTTANPDIAITSRNNATDGVNSARFNISQGAADDIQVSFGLPTLDGLYDDGTGNQAGVLVNRGNGYNDIDAFKAVGAAGQYAGRGVNSAIVLGTGSFTVQEVNGDSTVIAMSFLSPDQAPGSFRVNGGASTVISAANNADPYFGYTGLTLTAVPEPGTALAVAGLSALGLLRRRRR